MPENDSIVKEQEFILETIVESSYSNGYSRKRMKKIDLTTIYDAT